MEKLTSIIPGLEGRRELMLNMLSGVENEIMGAIADHDDMLRDCEISAIAQSSAIASKLLIFAHDLALGLPADSEVARQHVQEALAGLSALADMVFPAEDKDDEAIA